MSAEITYGDFLGEIAEMPSQVQPRPITEADTYGPNGEPFHAAWRFIVDMDIPMGPQAVCLMCSRRAAKTTSAQILTAKSSTERRRFRTLFIHHTRTLGKQQFYEPLRDLLRDHAIAEAHHDLTELNLTLDNGSFVQVVGCDDARDVGKKLGFKWDRIIIDECQEFRDSILERLVNKTILPTLIDKRGQLILMGTPADVEAGVWYKAITGDGFAPYRWTLVENPWIERQNVIYTMQIQGFAIDFENPENNDVLIQREIFGLQRIDARKLLYCYSPGPLFNDWPVEGIPLVDSGTWRYAMGIDIGGANEGNDRDAVVVLGWMTNDPEHRLWERESWEEREMDSEAFVARVLATYRRWRPMVAACGDTGGAGANKMLKVLAGRFEGLQFTPKPTSVDTSTRLLNDEFRSCRFKVNPLGLIARDAKICTKVETYHSDVMAACRYAHHGAYNYLAKEDPKPEAVNTDEAIRRRRRAQWQNEIRKSHDPWAGESGWRD